MIQNRLIFLTLIFVIIIQFNVNAFAFDYSKYSGILKKYLHTGKYKDGIRINAFDYKGLYREKNDPSSNYNLYLKQLADFNPSNLTNRNDKIAFWINAYNIGAIKIILDHFPTDSIRSMKINFFKNPWNKKIIKIDKKKYGLSQIEHSILLGVYGEKLIHFGIVCASVSCPDLIKDVYKGNTLYRQLKKQARYFLNSKSKGVRIDRNNKIVYVSKIFKFDKKNFSRGKDDIIPFILPYIKDKNDRDYLQNSNYTIKFLPYNWNLNNLRR